MLPNVASNRGSDGVARRVSVIDRVGVVKVSFKIKGGQIVEVTPLSGPREYFRPVQNAVRRFSCTSSQSEEVQVTFEISFKEG